MFKRIKKQRNVLLEILFSSILLITTILIGSIALLFFVVIFIYIIEIGETWRKKEIQDYY